MTYSSTIQDGIPHCTWYDRGSLTAFSWTGRPGDPIEVQPGGYGEPTTDLIEPPPALVTAALLDAFQDACAQWLADGEEWR